ncbi:MAG: hypothetical protein H0X67_14550 [Acidobacteria bacterium]|nr:hypothetical protein [Acidobacteriota bacterium]
MRSHTLAYPLQPQRLPRQQTKSLELPGGHSSGLARSFGDLLLLLAVVLCIPFVMIAVGTPLALILQFLLTIGGLL